MSSSLRFRPKTFVRASEDREVREAKKRLEEKGRDEEKRGREAADFYQEVLKTGEEPKKKAGKRKVKRTANKKKKKKIAPSKDPLKELFVASEADDVEAVEAILAEGKVGVDARDRFGWTALMAAACAGSHRATEALLAGGARMECRDRAGNCAESLAERKGRRAVLEVLGRHASSGQGGGGPDPGEAEEAAPEGEDSEFFCEFCRTRVSGGRSSRRRHLCSTVHQFSRSEGSSVPTLYGIPEANRGFQMMLGGGWDRERGLGPKGKEGKKFPVRTVLKRDRLGLGSADAPAPRVTHFAPNDPGGVEGPVKTGRTLRKATMDKRARLRAERKETAKERMFRQELTGL